MNHPNSFPHRSPDFLYGPLKAAPDETSRLFERADDLLGAIEYGEPFGNKNYVADPCPEGIGYTFIDKTSRVVSKFHIARSMTAGGVHLGHARITEIEPDVYKANLQVCNVTDDEILVESAIKSLPYGLDTDNLLVQKQRCIETEPYSVHNWDLILDEISEDRGTLPRQKLGPIAGAAAIIKKLLE